MKMPRPGWPSGDFLCVKCLSFFGGGEVAEASPEVG